MKLKIRHRAAVLFFGVFLLICASIGVVSFAQTQEGFVTEGESLDSIMIGKSTESDVISAYGKDYKLIDHKGYSYEMIYKNLGLAFYYCAADPNKEIFVIEMEPPSEAVTSKGIKLGESTFADISELYADGGEITSDHLEFEGIYFYSGVDDDEEDSEDARNQTPQPTPIDESQIERISEPMGERTDQSKIVLDGEDVSNISENSDDEEESWVNETPQAKQNQADKEEAANRRKIVKRIELVEKTGLRQCDDKFPKNKNK